MSFTRDLVHQRLAAPAFKTKLFDVFFYLGRNFNPLHDTSATSQSFCHCMMAFGVDCFPPHSNKGRYVQSKRNPTRNCRSMLNACTRPIGYVSCDGGVIGFGAQHVPNTHLCTVGRTDGWMNDGGPASGWRWLDTHEVKMVS